MGAVSNMSEQKKFSDGTWSDDEWRTLLEEIISKKLISWKDITTLTLGHMNPSQVGTSLASSKGFKRKYGKGEVMSKVMAWFYEQDGKCHDCGTRLELQADHNIPREDYNDPLDADFIENMVLRCRRCNVIKRPSHEYGGQTHLTAEAALMWILLSFQPRTLSDFVRMCRLYGMTMADVRMQEGWAMAHWLRKVETIRYTIDTDDMDCQILLWPDGGITRCWESDIVPNKDSARILSNSAFPNQHIVVLACRPLDNDAKANVHCLRYRVGLLPFSHYYPDDGPECLVITYTPPKRSKNEVIPTAQSLAGEDSLVQEDLSTIGQVGKESEATTTQENTYLPHGAKINLMPPRGMRFLDAKLIEAQDNVSITWTERGKEKALNILATSRGRKVCKLDAGKIEQADFSIR